MGVAKIAWLAGLIDGEGCIYIARRKPYGSVKSFTYVLGLKIAMCHEPTIRLVHDITGVGSEHGVSVLGGARANRAYSWVAVSHKAAGVIRQVRPYLVTKAAEADIALEFMGLPVTRFGNANAPDPSVLAVKFELWDRMRRAKSSFSFKEAHKEIVL